MKRLIQLWDLLYAAFHLWRELGKNPDAEAYAVTWEESEEPLFIVKSASNAVHFKDTRRKH